VIDMRRKTRGPATLLLIAFGALLLAAPPVFAGTRSYTGTISGGFGDGGDFITTTQGGSEFVTDFGWNALPACLIGSVHRSLLSFPTSLAPATNGIVPVRGTMMTAGASGARSITITLNNWGVPGQGGQKRVFNQTTCRITAPSFVLNASLTRRTQASAADWPAVSGMLSAGGGPGDQMRGGLLGPSQFASIMAGPAQFGGTVPRTGGGQVTLGIVTPGLGVNVGELPTGPQPLGGGGASGTTVTNMGTFMNSRLNTTNTVTLEFVVFPWTTGDVVAFDSGGDFITTRTAMGTDLRATTGPGAGVGNIQLVSPFIATIYGGAIATAPFVFSGVGVLNLNLPEPGAVGMLSAGLLGLVGVHLVRRRGRASQQPKDEA
jgi:hypothetical protein